MIAKRRLIEAAGIDYESVRLRRAPYTEQELTDPLRDLARKQPNMRRDELLTVPYRLALIKKFGSIDAALHRAELDAWAVRTREQMLDPKVVIRALRAR